MVWQESLFSETCKVFDGPLSRLCVVFETQRKAFSPEQTSVESNKT